MAEQVSPNWAFAGLTAFAIAGGITFAITVLILKYVHSSRQLLHAERIRSVELGHTWEEPESSKALAKYMHNAFWISFWLVVAVPSSAISGAATATNATSNHLVLGFTIWIVAGAVSIAAVVCATVLMVHSRSGRSVAPVDPNAPPPKPWG